MVIQIGIPQQIINTCIERGWDELEIKEYFSRYVRGLVNDSKDNLEQGFKEWLEGLVEEES